MSFKSTGYRAVERGFSLDWSKRSADEPVLDLADVSYGWIIKLDPKKLGITSVMVEDGTGKTIDQSKLGPIRDSAVLRLFQFYNKLNTETNREIARSNAIVKDVRVPTRPKSPTLFYVTIDARAFDNIPEKAKAVLQPVAEGSTLHSLADDYKGFFEINDDTEIGHRARVAEILKINNVDLESATKTSIKEWISSKNQHSVRRTSFDEGVKIYLPLISIPEPPSPAFIISLGIGEIQNIMNKANHKLVIYKEGIRTFNGKVENLTLQKNIDMLNEFYSSLRKHLSFNDIEIKNVLNDEIDIFLNEDYEVIYIALNRAGEKIPLVKGMPAMSSSAPFNDLRTMALLVSIREIGDLDVQRFPWRKFVEKYIVPTPEIKKSNKPSLYEQLQSDTKSAVEKLSSIFDKDSYKTEEDLEKEEKALADPSAMGRAAEQEGASVSFTGDSIVSNVPRIAAKLDAATKAGGTAGIEVAYNELLNRISVKELVKTAIDCLKSVLGCDEFVEAALESNLLIGYGFFKSKLPIESQYIADRALQIAQSNDFSMFDNAYATANLPANKTPGTKFISVLKYALRSETSLSYEVILDEVCAGMMNPPDSAQEIFDIPLMAFPDNLPTVDLQGTVATALREAIVNILIGLVVNLVQMMLDLILAACVDLETETSDTDYGSGDILEAISDKVGPPNLSEVLADLYDSLGEGPPSKIIDTGNPRQVLDPLANVVGTCALPDGSVVSLEKSACIAAGGTWTRGDPSSSLMDLENDLALTSDDLRKDVAEKCSLIKKLLNDLSVVLTPAEITALFNASAPENVLETIVDVIKLRHAKLYEKVKTKEDVSELFIKLEKISEVGTILSQITVISRGLGCTFESNCIRQDLRKANFDGDVPDDGNLGRILTLLDPLALTPPPTFCEERGSNIDNGLIPKDNASLLFVLKKVIAVMYDGIYMAYDSEVLRIPDALSVVQEMPKIVPRTTKIGASIDIDYFNMFKLQEETFTVEFPEWLPKKTVINPEFQRLVSGGFIPPDGDYAGRYGPYTTEKSKLLGIGPPIPFSDFGSLDPIRVSEKYFVFASNSKAGLKSIDKLKLGSDSAPDGSNRMFFALTEPFKGQGFKPSTFSLKFSLASAKFSNDMRNNFILQIGDIPVDPSTIPIGNLTAGQVNPPLNYGPFESAIYRSRIAGVTSIDAQARKIVGALQERRGNDLITPGSIPQVDVLFGFTDVIAQNGGQQSPSFSRSLKDFVYKGMYNDLIVQIMSGIGDEIYSTPLFKRTKDDKTPYVKIVDWAPIPTDEERDCDFDPHILALDTVKKRTKEAYEQYIKCAPLEDEISVDGLGRPNLSALEAAGMTGCVMTTLRAYALEQLLRSMYAVSVFAGEEFITKLMVEYVIEETLRGIKRISPAYYDAFLGQVEVIFALRMKEENPFGSIPDILAQSSELGINWMYASPAIKEFNGEVTGEEVGAEESDSVNSTEQDCEAPDAPPEEPASSVKSTKEQMVRSRIRFLAEEQLYSLMPKLQDLICLEGTLTFDDNFLNRRLPLFDIQREKGEVRLAKILESLKTMEEQELQRQYGEYLKEFSDWQDDRLGSLLTKGFGSILDIGGTLGLSTACMSEAFNLNLPSVGSLNETGAEIQTLLGETSITDPLAGVTAVGEHIIGGINDTIGGFNSALGDFGNTFGELRECARLGVAGGTTELENFGTQRADGLTGIGKNMLSLISDSPPPLEEFGTGLEEGTTDRIGNADTFARGEHKGEIFLSNGNGSLILEKYIKVRKRGFVPTPGVELPPDLQSNLPATLDTGQEVIAPDIIGNIEEEQLIPPQMDISTNNPVPSAPPGAGSINIPTNQQFGSTTAEGLSISQILCPREVEDTSNRRNTPFVNNPLDNTPEEEAFVSPLTNVSLIPDINPKFEQIYNIQEWEDTFNQISLANPNTKFEDLYESWSCGVRMVYVAPTNEFQEVPDNSLPGEASSKTLKIPTGKGDFNPVKFLLDNEIIDSSRSYRQFERLEVDRKEVALDYEFPAAMAHARGEFDTIISGPERAERDAILAEIQTGNDAGILESINSLSVGTSKLLAFQGGNIANSLNPFGGPGADSMLNTQQISSQLAQARAIKKIQMERSLTIFPLVEVAIPINIDGKTRLSEVFSSLNVGRTKKNKNLDELWTRRFMTKLMRQMKESPGYKLLFKYCVPSHTFLSFASIYANLLNEMPETFFDGTKGELKTLFEILLNGGDYTFENEEEKKRGGNREQMAHAQGNMGTDGGARKPGLFDLAVQTPKLIFKGLAEFLDPVIAPAAVIVKAGKAGKLLPKLMKKLDSDGNETEDNFLLDVTVGPYDLPPPMGKFNIPLPGADPTKEGLSDDPSENISFQLPVFELKDTITGESLSPFLREKVFALKNGTEFERQLYYEFSKAIAQFNVVTVIKIVTKIYLEQMNSTGCDSLVKVDGKPIIPIPTLVYPGDKLDLPISPVALSVIPMDTLAGYGPGPSHTPLGHIYHGIVAAEGLQFPDIDAKARQRAKAGLENKKKPEGKLCIDVDLIREEEDRRRG
tara:strand:+ start:1950 stop:9539 length:7590 start_codon:yes stop_codon:yes gene_type:complete